MANQSSTMESMVNRTVEPNFWKNKKVFITGHTGFKGGWLCVWLQSMGAIVKGYALAPYTNPSIFVAAKIQEGMESEIGDIRNLENITKSIHQFKPDVLIHMAAQPLVRYSYKNPIETYSTNVMGTVNVLEAARKCNSIKAIVSVTTDKCYENKEWVWGYRENEPMGGYDPYSSSKGCAELVTTAYRRSYFNQANVQLASARAGNVIGGGDWSEDRLIPDAIKAFERNQNLIIRNPLAIRPWQHVLEPLSGYLILAEDLYQKGNNYAEAWNFGPDDKDCLSVEQVLNQFITIWGNNAAWELDKNANPHEAGFLKLDCSKAKAQLHWTPKWDINQALNQIVKWHNQWQAGADMKEECLNQIKQYNNECR